MEKRDFAADAEIKNDWVIEIEVETLNLARKQIKSRLPKGIKYYTEDIRCDGEPLSIEAAAETVKEAAEIAEKKVPLTATILKREKTPPEMKAIRVTAFDEKQAAQHAVSTAEQLFPRTHLDSRSIIAKRVKMIMAGNKGFLGMGSKPNLYEVEVQRQAVVKITFKPYVKIELSAKRYFEDVLAEAIDRGDLAGTEELIRSGIDINAKNEIGRTPLMYAAIVGDKNIADWLIRNGANINDHDHYDTSGMAYGYLTPLMHAAMHGFPEIVKLLLAQHADVHATDEDGHTALDIAISHGQKKVAAILQKVK